VCGEISLKHSVQVDSISLVCVSTQQVLRSSVELSSSVEQESSCSSTHDSDSSESTNDPSSSSGGSRNSWGRSRSGSGRSNGGDSSCFGRSRCSNPSRSRWSGSCISSSRRRSRGGSRSSSSWSTKRAIYTRREASWTSRATRPGSVRLLPLPVASFGVIADDIHTSSVFGAASGGGEGVVGHGSAFDRATAQEARAGPHVLRVVSADTGTRVAGEGVVGGLGGPADHCCDSLSGLGTSRADVDVLSDVPEGSSVVGGVGGSSGVMAPDALGCVVLGGLLQERVPLHHQHVGSCGIDGGSVEVVNCEDLGLFPGSQCSEGAAQKRHQAERSE
jgi:hypothetical protein